MWRIQGLGLIWCKVNSIYFAKHKLDAIKIILQSRILCYTLLHFVSVIFSNGKPCVERRITKLESIILQLFGTREYYDKLFKIMQNYETRDYSRDIHLCVAWLSRIPLTCISGWIFVLHIWMDICIIQIKKIKIEQA